MATIRPIAVALESFTIFTRPRKPLSFQRTVRLRRNIDTTPYRCASSSAQRRSELATYGGSDADAFIPFDVASIPSNAILSDASDSRTETKVEQKEHRDEPWDISALEPSIKVREDLRDGDVPDTQEGLAQALHHARSHAASSNRPSAPLRKTVRKSAQLHIPQSIRQSPKPEATSPPPNLPRKPLEPWQSQKSSLRQKFPEGYKPIKRLSPDAIEGIRALHTSNPSHFTTANLSQQFEVSPEAIRRILKSKWRPNGEEEEKRRERWERRGERIWGALVEKGVHAPRTWRERGIGRGKRVTGGGVGMVSVMGREVESPAVRAQGAQRRQTPGVGAVDADADASGDGGERWLGGLTGWVG